jgi:small GTP-binding protein
MSSRSKVYDNAFKLITLGNSGVGKTSLILRYCDSLFSPTFITSIGVDFKIKNLVIDDKRIRLNIWDTAGQERFRNITNSYIRGSNGVLMVYDITDRKSFIDVNQWIASIKEHSGLTTPIIILANKCDMESTRQVTKTEGELLAKKYNLPFFEVSARKNTNISEAIEILVNSMLEKVKPITGGATISLDEKPTKKKCC